MKKLKNKKGETLVETLVATLIVASTFVMLCGAIVSAARVNKSAETMNGDIAGTAAGTTTVTITHQNGTSTETNVPVYEINGNYFYDK